MDEFDGFKSIKAYLYEKSTSPLAGAFVAAWLVLNHRVLFMLFSDEHYSKSFAAVDTYFARPLIAVGDEVNTFISFVNSTAPLVYGVLFPFLLALAYIYIYPVIAEPVYKQALKKRKELRDLKQKADKQRLLSEEESAELYARMERIRTEAETTSSRYAKEIDALNMTIRELNTHVDELRGVDYKTLDIPTKSEEDEAESEGPESDDEKRAIYPAEQGHLMENIELSDEEASVLSATSNGTLNSLINSKGISAQRIRYAQDRLAGHGFIGRGSGRTIATPEGREWLNNQGLLK